MTYINSLVERNKELRYKIPMFNNKGEFYVGRTLKKLMAELISLSSIDFENFQNLIPTDTLVFLRPYYKPAKVDLEITFLTFFLFLRIMITIVRNTFGLYLRILFLRYNLKPSIL